MVNIKSKNIARKKRAITGAIIANIERINAVPFSMVATIKFPNPAVTDVETALMDSIVS